MKAIEYWKVLFQQHKEPCFLANLDTFEVFYKNAEMEILCGKDNSASGKSFFDFFEYAKDEKNRFNPNILDEIGVYTTTAFDTRFKKSYDVSISKVYYKDRSALLCQYSPQGELVASNFEYEIAMSKCVNVLDSEDRIASFLQILGEFHLAELVFLFTIDKHAQKIPANHIWSVDSSKSQFSDITDYFSFPDLMSWFETRNENGFLVTDTTTTTYKEDSIDYLIAKNFETNRLAQCIITDLNNEPIAIIAIVNANRFKGDHRLCKTIERFMQNEISKIEKQVDFDVIGKKDFLTGFYSRVSYSEYIKELKDNPPKKLGLVFANINGLRQINEEHDYTVGDSCIKEASIIIRNFFKANFYRLSGDEFVGFFPNVDKEYLEKQVRELRNIVKEQHNNLFALGYAWGGNDYDPVDLVKEADTVMYINKQEYYASSKRTFQDITDNSLNELLESLKKEEFLIYLQPQVHLSDGSLYGAEALIRKFDKSAQKMVFPDQFIPLYEKKSIIRHIDIYVVEQVCKVLQRWQQLGDFIIPISVNLSRVTLLEFDIVDTIAAICDKYNVPRENLVIEVTERVGLVENDVASSLITEFKAKGFKISLDDFGCAYSNIVTLAQIEVDEVKVDKSLVDFMTTNVKNQILVRNVLRMCNELDSTSTLAEGIEDKEQADLLHSLGCHLGQGYYYSRPIPVTDFCNKYCNEIEDC